MKTELFLSLIEEVGMNQIVSTVYSYAVAGVTDRLVDDVPWYDFGGLKWDS